MVTVKELMTHDVSPVSPTLPINGVARLMRDSGKDVIPVCQNGQFRGVIIGKDLVSILASGTSQVC